jgi:hypothetical protein
MADINSDLLLAECRELLIADSGEWLGINDAASRPRLFLRLDRCSVFVGEGIMSFDGRTPFAEDERVIAEIDKALAGMTPGDILQAFPIYARRIHLKRFLAHYELFRMVMDLPGDIVELGVFHGVSLMSWANFLEIRCMGDRQRRVWGFDSFTGLSELAPQDGMADANVGKIKGGYGAHAFGLEVAIKIFDSDRFIPHKARVELVAGDICETVPQWVINNPGVRISLLHFDCDLYKPTLTALKALWPLVVSGGVVAFDEYAIAPWEGESRAVDEFFETVQLRRFTWSSNPGAYVVKP